MTDAALVRLPVTCVERPWGGSGVPRLGLQSEPGKRIGEYWLPATGFPLQVKVIDARERLSIQVHPDDGLGRELGFESGKTEAWYVLDALPDAELWLGLAPGVTAGELLASARRGERVAHLLRRFAPKPGESYFVPAGTVHAIGAGMTVLEIQQPVDVTWRIDDWGRLPARPLHLDEAARAVRETTLAGRNPPPAGLRDGDRDGGRTARQDVVIDCDSFAVERILAVGKARIAARDVVEMWFCAAGKGTIATGAMVEVCVPGAFFLTRPRGGSLDLEPARSSPDCAPLEFVRMARR